MIYHGYACACVCVFVNNNNKWNRGDITGDIMCIIRQLLFYCLGNFSNKVFSLNTSIVAKLCSVI